MSTMTSLLPSLVLHVLLALNCHASFAFQLSKPPCPVVSDIIASHNERSSALHLAREPNAVAKFTKSKRETNDNDNSKRHQFTEIDRLKFRVHQLKGNMVESEMRATAAERRVALLQEDLKAHKTETNNGAAADDSTTVATKAAALNEQIAELQSQLDVAQSELGHARVENDELRKSVSEKRDLRRQLSEAEKKVRQKSEYAEATSVELERLRTEMIETIARTKEAARKEQQELKVELVSVQDAARVEQKRIVEEKDRKIVQYKKERESVRKLAKRLAVTIGRRVSRPFRRA
mmetsp:Transcript_5585/g.15715  ORF Transcript_5585/g.15715 Transcript_5585/m.15715 type:complete len:292 (+) Transcript_5585:203-1078(+)